MIRAFFTALFFSLIALTAQAQQAWVQIEAQPTLTAAQDRARLYSGRYADVSGYYLGSGWYGIVLGPYAAVEAEALLNQLRREGGIPGDSFVADGSRFQQQFWPIGGSIAVAPAAEQPVAEPLVVTEPEAPVVSDLPDETVGEARTSEAALSEDQRKALQVALQWAGYYDSAIDGAFGRGTRSSMGAWQLANGYQATGVLTTRQRTQLMAAYNAVLEGLDLELLTDTTSGISILIPTAVVEFDRYEPPFARFKPTGELAAQVLLISQAGDSSRLAGLYEILQTLEIVPQQGTRSRTADSFSIEGIGNGIHTSIQAQVIDGQVKGFALVWPQGDDERRSRLWAEMVLSFVAIDGVLDPAVAPADEDQAIDMIAGLQVRQPRLSLSGFYLDGTGTVLTSSDAVADCERITIDTAHEATVAHVDPTLGLAVLRPGSALAPVGYGRFQTAVPRLQTEVAVAGYPYGGVLTRPSLTFGRLADIRGLNGEDEVKRLALTARPGDAGGPVLDAGGAVLGMLLPRAPLNGQDLPADVAFALDSDTILAALAAAGIGSEASDAQGFVTQETLTVQASAMTVLVSCW